MPPRDSDAFLGGRLQIRQSVAGFRAGLDSVMLAAAIPDGAGQTMLELGAGVGTVSLCLAARVRQIRIVSVEIDADLMPLLQENFKNNALDAVCTPVLGDVFDLPAALRCGFDQVFCNPPFYASDGMVSPDPARARARHDGGRLADWLKTGVKRTRSGGCFTAIFPAERLNEALAALPDGGITVFPLWPKAGVAAKRVIVQARIGAKSPLKLLAGLVLHDADGGFTPVAEGILRHGDGLTLVPGASGH